MPSTTRLGCLYFFGIKDVLHKPCATVILRSPIAARFRILGHAIVVAAHLERLAIETAQDPLTWYWPDQLLIYISYNAQELDFS